MGRQTDGQVKMWTYKHTERHTSQMDRCTDERGGEQIDGKRVRWTERQMG